ncbi:MAG: hypothetical protein QME81_00200 [bacterium]|nr:hypothetical protein [bacterium]
MPKIPPCSRYSLVFGVIGSLIGLINMLATMEDPKAIGCIMAVCVLTVFYGLLLGQFIYSS